MDSDRNGRKLQIRVSRILSYYFSHHTTQSYTESWDTLASELVDGDSQNAPILARGVTKSEDSYPDMKVSEDLLFLGLAFTEPEKKETRKLAVRKEKVSLLHWFFPCMCYFPIFKPP